MGNVGNIEKVMVFGILAIILCILGIAVWGHQSVVQPEDQLVDGNIRVDDDEEGAPPSTPSLKVTLNGGDDPQLLPVPPDDPVEPEIENVNEPSVVPPEPKLPTKHTIRAGDTYSGLAKKYFDDANLWREFEKANEDFDANRLREGMVINVPQLDLSRAELLDPDPSDVPPKPQPATGGRTYVVQKGDTLSAISTKFYDTSSKWRAIADANTDVLPNPDRLRPGIELRIP